MDVQNPCSKIGRKTTLSVNILRWKYRYSNILCPPPNTSDYSIVNKNIITRPKPELSFAAHLWTDFYTRFLIRIPRYSSHHRVANCVTESSLIESPHLTFKQRFRCGAHYAAVTIPCIFYSDKLLLRNRGEKFVRTHCAHPPLSDKRFRTERN